jgi:hypothetical protein
VSTIDDRAFELWAMETLEGNPTEAWISINSLWNNLALAEKPVHERIVRRMNALITERSTSEALYLRIEDACVRSPAPKVRWLPYDIAAFRAAAVCNAHRPNASNRQIAMHKSVGVSEKTIRNWKQDYAFEFKLAGQKPHVPDSQIFSPVMWEPISLAGEGGLIVNEQIIRAADRK